MFWGLEIFSWISTDMGVTRQWLNVLIFGWTFPLSLDINTLNLFRENKQADTLNFQNSYVNINSNM